MRYRPISIVLVFLLVFQPVQTGYAQNNTKYHFKLNIIKPNCGGPPCLSEAYFIADFLEDLGIETEVQITPWYRVFERSLGYTNGSVPIYDDGGYDLIVLSFSLDTYFTPESLYSQDLASNDSELRSNWLQYDNSTFDNLYEQYISATDQENIKELAIELQQLIHADQAIIPLHERTDIIPMAKSIETHEQLIEELFVSQSSDLFKFLKVTGSDTVTIGGLYPFKYFSPLSIQANEYNYLQAIWQPLYDWNSTSKTFVPLLASKLPEWNGNSVSIKLRNNVTFSDGTLLSANHVIESLRYHLSPVFNENNFEFFSDQFNNASFTALSDREVRIEFSNPGFDFMEYLNIFVLPTHIWGPANQSTIPDLDIKSAIVNQTSTYAVGTGPFTFDFMELQDDGEDHAIINNAHEKIVLRRNSNYWNGQVRSEYLQYLRYEGIGSSGIVEKIGTGDIDLPRSSYPWRFVRDRIDYSTTKLHNISSTVVTSLFINHNHPIIGSGVDTPKGVEQPDQTSQAAKNVRKALSYAIDKKNITASNKFNLPDGYAEISNTMWSRQSFGYWENGGSNEHDLESAKTHLVSAGYSISDDRSLPMTGILTIISSMLAVSVILKRKQITNL